MAQSKIVLAINECCRDARSKLRRFVPRRANAVPPGGFSFSSPGTSPSFDGVTSRAVAFPALHQACSPDGQAVAAVASNAGFPANFG